MLSVGIAATISVIGTNAYGAGNIRLLGYTLLLGLSMCSVASLFICIATYFAGDAMYWLIGFDASMRQLVTDYARISIIGIFPYHWSNCIGQWLLAQKRVFPQLATYGVVAAANVGLNFLFIYGAGQWPGFGFVGSDF